MTPEQKAKELGIEFPEQKKGYLNLCCRAGNLYFLSGHVSDMKGILGDNASRQASLKNLSVEEGQKAARECAVKLLRSVRQANGTLDGLRIIKLLGCVYSAPTFTDQHLVINGASDLFHEIFGKDGDGYHARSALGFAALPTGAAVEVEAIIEIKHA
ncbi:MAG: RidA family protein [Pirellulaceae bacterium]